STESAGARARGFGLIEAMARNLPPFCSSRKIPFQSIIIHSANRTLTILRDVRAMAGGTPTQAPPSVEPDPGEVAARTPRDTSRRSRLARMFWPTLCLFQLGLFVGLFRLWTAGAAPPEDGHAPEQSASVAPAAAPTDGQPAAPPPTIDLGRADDLLRQGRYELALALYQPVCGDGAAPASD